MRMTSETAWVIRVYPTIPAGYKDEARASLPGSRSAGMDVSQAKAINALASLTLYGLKLADYKMALKGPSAAS